MFVICFISQCMERTKHGLYVFPPKKTLIWRRHCSIDQSCSSMTSKQFLQSSSGMKFVYPSVRLANQNPGAFVSVRYTNQIALFPFVCCFCFVLAFSFQGHTKIALFSRGRIPPATHVNLPRLQGTQPGTLTICMENAVIPGTVHPDGIPLKDLLFAAFTGPTKIFRTICLDYQCQNSALKRKRNIYRDFVNDLS